LKKGKKVSQEKIAHCVNVASVTVRNAHKSFLSKLDNSLI